MSSDQGQGHGSKKGQMNITINTHIRSGLLSNDRQSCLKVNVFMTLCFHFLHVFINENVDQTDRKTMTMSRKTISNRASFKQNTFIRLHCCSDFLAVIYRCYIVNNCNGLRNKQNERQM